MTEERKATKRLKASCPCESCKRGRGLPHKIKSGSVYSYSSAPINGWQFKRTVQEIIADPSLNRDQITGGTRGWSRTNIPLFMGVELETDTAEAGRYGDGPRYEPEPTYPRTPWGTSPEESRRLDVEYQVEWRAWNDRQRSLAARWFADHQSPMTPEEATSLARPGAFWWPKHDSSVSGPEFVSMPATMAWWNSRQESMRRMFDGLVHAGMRSYQYDHCGMHINMNTSAFQSATHLFNMLSLMLENKSWSLKMSQRTVHSSHWANFENGAIASPVRRLRWAEHVVSDGWASQDRYGVFNASNEGRVEFRLPRGTLRIDRFYKNLEWTVAMFEYAKQASPSMKPADFHKWTLARRAEYPNLCAFIDEKFSRTVAVKEAASAMLAGSR